VNAEIEARAAELRERGVAASAAGHPVAAVRYLRRGLALLGWTGPDDKPDSPHLAGRLLVSLAHAEAERGRVPFGLALLDEAERLLSGDDLGVLLQQRGLLLLRLGRTAEALPLLDRAVPLLAHEPVVQARTLLNRGALHLHAGRVRAAVDDLRRSRRLAYGERQYLIAAKTVHSLGDAALLEGDIPGALRAFDRAARGYRTHGPGVLPLLLMDKARALLAAGLAGEAGRELDEALRLARRQRLSQDYAEAELARAQAALAGGELATARRFAARAAAHSRRRGNEAWATLADLTALRVAYATGRAPGALAVRAVELAGRLRRLGLRHDALTADLYAVRALVRAGRHRPGRLPTARGAPLETRLLAYLARAEVAVAAGRRGSALRDLRTGLVELHRHRVRFGSTDLQSGSTALGVELARTGLATALDTRSPRLVFSWSERSRAQAFRIRPVRPEADAETVDAVAELRQLHKLLREAELEGRTEPGLRQRRTELERFVRERGWQASGAGESTAVAPLDEVAAAVAAAGRTLVVLIGGRPRLTALVVHGGSARLADLGDRAAVEEAARRLVADLNVLAGRRLPDRLREVVLASVRRQRAHLADLLLAPLSLGDDELILVPVGWLSAVPWGVLPPLTGRPVTVAPSASAWLRAYRAASAPCTVGPPLLVAGPHLQHAAAEVHAIATLDPASRVLSGPAATVEATMRGLDGAAVAHFATHGHHEPENVLFSRLDLADGPLMAYDLQHLAVPPRQAVLSACDVGRTVVRPGDEILGFTAALLYAGTTSVVSSTVRVPDEAAIHVMIAYHRAVSAGAQPARALAAASLFSLSGPLAPFVCFGAG